MAYIERRIREIITRSRDRNGLGNAGLDLCRATIDEKFYAVDIARVI